jgi:hypothetical protein
MLGWLAWTLVWMAAPHHPDATHIIQKNNHGTTVYLTPLEAIFGPLCWLIGFCAAVAGWILKWMDKGKTNPSVTST